MPEKLTDKSLMPIGKFTGELMESVPAWYLIQIFDKKYEWVPNNVIMYIAINYDLLNKEVKNQRRYGK